MTGTSVGLDSVLGKDVLGIVTKTTGTKGHEKNISQFMKLNLQVLFSLEKMNPLGQFTQC